jgi:predicted nicotinamide N-methyase
MWRSDVSVGAMEAWLTFRLELGSGGGLVGLALSHALSIRTTITDQDLLLSLMTRNVELNSLSNLCTADVLDWSSPIPPSIKTLQPNIILAADCVYFEPAFEPLLDTMESLLALTENAEVWCCFRRRRRADMRFVKMAGKRFEVVKIEIDERWSRDRVFLFKLTKKFKRV